MISSHWFTDQQFPSVQIGMVYTKRFFDQFIPIISEGALTVLRLNLRLGGLREKKEQNIKYRKGQHVGEARGGWLLERLMEN
jgi:hypothetical protein